MHDFTLISRLEELLEGIFELPRETPQIEGEEGFMQKDEEHEDEAEYKHSLEMQYE